MREEKRERGRKEGRKVRWLRSTRRGLVFLFSLSPSCRGVFRQKNRADKATYHQTQTPDSSYTNLCSQNGLGSDGKTDDSSLSSSRVGSCDHGWEMSDELLRDDVLEADEENDDGGVGSVRLRVWSCCCGSIDLLHLLLVVVPLPLLIPSQSCSSLCTTSQGRRQHHPRASVQSNDQTRLVLLLRFDDEVIVEKFLLCQDFFSFPLLP